MSKHGVVPVDRRGDGNCTATDRLLDQCHWHGRQGKPAGRGAERGTRIAEGGSASKAKATIATSDFIDSADLTEAVD